MTKKRYKAIPETVEYKDTVTGEFLSPKFEEDFYKVLDLLNDNDELNNENKELKEILKHTYEVHECETCKHNQDFNWLDPATMKREYDSKCSKGLHDGEEVHGCEEYELDLEMFKKRVKG